MTTTPQNQPAPFERGDIVRTRSGKLDAVVLRYVRATPADLAARLIEETNRRGHGRLPIKQDYVIYRSLRDGKPYGPQRSASPDTLTLVRKADAR